MSMRTAAQLAQHRGGGQLAGDVDAVAAAASEHPPDHQLLPESGGD